MSTSNPRRVLSVDDPLAEACPVARPTDPGGRLREIPLEAIHPNADQPRKRFDDGALNALADSIRERGVLQPIIVQPRDAGGFQLIAGERRWRASVIAGLVTIPALVDAAVDGAVSLELALIENMAREDLSPIEQARTIAVLLDDLSVSRADLGRRLGRSRSDLAHTVRLLELPDQAIELIDTGVLSKGHGKVLLTEPDHACRRTLARRAAELGWSVRALEAVIASTATSSSPRSQPHPDHQAAASRLGEAISRAIGSEVRARPHSDGYLLQLDLQAGERLMRLVSS